MLPKVAVIIPAYNHERFVEETLVSVLSQEYENFDVIVIDDGSSDSTCEQIQKLINMYNNIKLIKNYTNIGLTKTLNKGLHMALDAEFIIMIASDDKFLPGRIKSQVDYLISNPDALMVYGLADLMDDNSVVFGEISIAHKEGNLFNELFTGRFNLPAYTCMYRNEVLKKVGYFSEDAFIEDSDIWLKISKLGKIGFLNKKVAVYRRHATNMSKRYVDLYNDHVKRVNKYSNEPLYREAINAVHIDGFFNVSFVDKKRAIAIFFKIRSGFLNKKTIAGVFNIIGLSCVVKWKMNYR